MPVTRAPRRAMASARMPPPQPTSSTSLPVSAAWRSIHSRRSGLISCSGRNSPCGSHQRWARASNFSSSAWSTLDIGPIVPKKSPAEAGLSCEAVLLLLAGADDLDLGAAVGRQALDHLLVAAIHLAHLLAAVAGHRLGLALAFGVDAVRLEAS